MTVKEFIVNEGYMSAYTTWLADPVTKRMLALAEDNSKPSGLAVINGEHALYTLGLAVGSNYVLGILGKLDEMAVHVPSQRLQLEDGEL